MTVGYVNNLFYHGTICHSVTKLIISGVFVISWPIFQDVDRFDIHVVNFTKEEKRDTIYHTKFSSIFEKEIPARLVSV